MSSFDSTQHYQDLLFDSVESIEKDQQYWFQINGDHPNSLIDAAIPLLGLASRVRTLSDCYNVDDVYQQVVEEIQAIDAELEGKYEEAQLNAYRYVLCATLDEAILSTPWGGHSCWSQQSLLAKFFNETWSGEKVYQILERLSSEPEKYRTLLEFIHLCLALGFEGKYRVIENGQAERDKVIAHLHKLLGFDELQHSLSPLVANPKHSANVPIKLKRRLSTWQVLFLIGGIVSAAYVTYSQLLASNTDHVLQQLQQLL
ncbi:type IVB secretion system protein IcmH/DotU [Vibrio sp. LaRot3]|uniref:type IVB secretion system protein IcmH/DotU n=1 Tax=Vibrio sp. LaRot3 TaxID=2998829 RepID=UPI0022CDDF71|nr:type IVB secretion system protein IcmH/DotU [Vibrio sp. LaRot3]MDA0148881.1 type IVB secretion system protein IcmH/DotU [Vibrio sp. LaRot3]